MRALQKHLTRQVYNAVSTAHARWLLETVLVSDSPGHSYVIRQYLNN